MALIVMMATGCNQKKDTAVMAGQKESSIEITQPAGNDAPWIIRTKSAEFHILGNGSVNAFLLRDGTRLTIDQHLGNGASADSVFVNAKEVSDLLFQPSPKSSDAKGKLGIGKRIEFVSKSASTGLEKTTAIEVYDDFPNMAIVTTAYKNTGSSDVKLEKVITQRHQFDAALTDKNAKPYQMWSFQGSSLDWGKDEILPIPAKFSQQ
ncbi:MAG TPA: hypothetical protein VFM10_03450, partial [Terriglobales bacterium]|nr:hypothetical protein [Terriglobales bacterium]